MTKILKLQKYDLKEKDAYCFRYVGWMDGWMLDGCVGWMCWMDASRINDSVFQSYTNRFMLVIVQYFVTWDLAFSTSLLQEVL